MISSKNWQFCSGQISTDLFCVIQCFLFINKSYYTKIGILFFLPQHNHNSMTYKTKQKSYQWVQRTLCWSSSSSVPPLGGVYYVLWLWGVTGQSVSILQPCTSPSPSAEVSHSLRGVLMLRACSVLKRTPGLDSGNIDWYLKQAFSYIIHLLNL